MTFNIKANNDDLDTWHNDLIHSIYALVDYPDEWVHTLQMLERILQQSDHIPQHDIAASMMIHIQRADLLLLSMNKLQLSEQQNYQVMDCVPMAIILMQVDGMVLYSNRRAKEILPQLPVHQPFRKLHFLNQTHQSTLMKTVRKVLKEHLHGEALKLGDTELWISKHRNDQLILFFSNHSIGPLIHRETLQTMYGMTTQEARLTAELCTGKGQLDQVAKTLNINISTARSHLKKIFIKMGVHSQAELMKIIVLNPALTQLKHDPSFIENNPYRLTQLSSGRTLSWSEYGDPLGNPVLFCHPITSCRLLPVEITKNLHQQHIRLIVPDRAGYGQSTPASQDVMMQWLDDMKYFVLELGIERYDVIGYSAGGAYAMALSIEQPDQVQRLHLISSVAPYHQGNPLKKTLPINRLLYHCVQNNPKTSRAFLNLALRSIVKKPHIYFQRIMSNLPETDRTTLKTNRLKERLLEGFEETHRQGIEHITEETMYILKHWHIQATEIHCPTIIWHGLADKHAPVHLMQNFEKSLPVCVQNHYLPEHGHYLLYSQWNEIVKQLSYSSLSIK